MWGGRRVGRGSALGADQLGLAVLDLAAVAVVDHGLLVERVAAGEHQGHLVVVDAPGPGADHQGGDGVAGEVGDRAGLGHEPVDADDQADAVDQLGAVRGEAAGQRGQTGAGDPGGALRGDHHEDQQRDLLADASAGRPSRWR